MSAEIGLLRIPSSFPMRIVQRQTQILTVINVWFHGFCRNVTLGSAVGIAIPSVVCNTSYSDG